MQMLLFGQGERMDVAPFKTGLLKWIGNKQRMAHEIASYFPADFTTYYEPFLGMPQCLAPSSRAGPLVLTRSRRWSRFGRPSTRTRRS